MCSVSADDILYPEIEPYTVGFIPVSGNHEIYYEECGNPDGYPILFVHGAGPGHGCYKRDRRFFDPAKWRIILFDQRGGGRSKPQGKIYDATIMQDTVDDMRVLLERLSLDKVVLFGGSWGSAVSLVYFVTHPEKVAALVLRGIFLSGEEMRYYPEEGSVTNFLPWVRAQFIEPVPHPWRLKAEAWYKKELEELTPADPRARELSYRLARYRSAVRYISESYQQWLDNEKDDKNRFSETLHKPERYFRTLHFVDKDVILWNISKIPAVPVVIVQGLYDTVCPPKAAFLLSKRLPHAKVCYVRGGHYTTNPEICKTLVAETRALFYRLQK